MSKVTPHAGLTTSILLFMVLLVIPSHLPAQEVDRSLGLREITSGYYVYLHGDGAPAVSSNFNSGIIVTDDGVLVIDALSSEAIAHRVREAVSRVTSQPIRFLVSSAFHKRFTGGNAVYADVFRVGHENYRADLLKLLTDEPAEMRKIKLPQLTYRQRLTLYLGGKEIQILDLGRAHTRGDTIVFVPADRIAYLSEVFNFDEFPYIADGYSADWMRTLEAVEALLSLWTAFSPTHSGRGSFAKKAA